MMSIISGFVLLYRFMWVTHDSGKPAILWGKERGKYSNTGNVSFHWEYNYMHVYGISLHSLFRPRVAHTLRLTCVTVQLWTMVGWILGKSTKSL